MENHGALVGADDGYLRGARIAEKIQEYYHTNNGVGTIVPASGALTSLQAINQQKLGHNLQGHAAKAQ